MIMAIVSVFFLLTACQPKDKYDQMILDNNKKYTYNDIGQVGDTRYINSFGNPEIEYTEKNAMKFWDAWLINDEEGMKNATDDNVPSGMPIKAKIIDKEKGMCKVGVMNASEVFDNPNDYPKEFWIMCGYFNEKIN